MEVKRKARIAEECGKQTTLRVQESHTGYEQHEVRSNMTDFFISV